MRQEDKKDGSQIMTNNGGHSVYIENIGEIRAKKIFKKYGKRFPQKIVDTDGTEFALLSHHKTHKEAVIVLLPTNPDNSKAIILNKGVIDSSIHIGLLLTLYI